MINYQNLIYRKKMTDIFFIWVGRLLLVSVLAFLLIIFISAYLQGAHRLNMDFFLNYPSRFAEKAGVLSAWVGSVIIAILTLIISSFLGVCAGIYLELFAKKNHWSKILEISVLTMAGVPSIIFGLFAHAFFVQAFGLGETILTAAFTLSLLVLPIVIVTTRESIKAIPSSLFEAALALGASRSQWLFHHLIPYSMSGITTGLILAMARAIGETAPLIAIGALSFIAFLPSSPFQLDPPFINLNFLFDSFTTLPIQIYNWISRPDQKFHQNAAAATFVLLCFSASLNILAQIVRWYYRKKYYQS